MKYIKEYDTVDEYLADVEANPYPILCRMKTEEQNKLLKKVFYRKIMTDKSNPEAMEIARNAGWVGLTDTYMTITQAIAVTDESFNAANILVSDSSTPGGYRSLTFANLKHFDEFQFFVNVTKTTFTDITYEGQAAKQGGFFGAYDLERITLPPNMITIGNYCFRNSKLKEITFPSSLKQVSVQAFAFCTLSHVNMNHGLNVIQNYAFAGSSIGYAQAPGIPGGTQLLPDTLTYIGHGAFSNVYDTYPGKFQEILNLPRLMLFGEEVFMHQYKPREIHIGDRLQTLGNGADYTGQYNDIFWDMLETITIDENNPNFKVVNNIVYSKDGTICYGGADYGLSKLNVVKIAEGVTKLMAGSFRTFMAKMDNGAYTQVCPWYDKNNEVCQYIVLPSTLTYIGDRSGQYAANGLKLVCLATTPPTREASGNNAQWYMVSGFYVPEASVDAYKAASGWSAFASKIYAITPEISAAIA